MDLVLNSNNYIKAMKNYNNNHYCLITIIQWQLQNYNCLCSIKQLQNNSGTITIQILLQLTQFEKQLHKYSYIIIKAQL